MKARIKRLGLVLGLALFSLALTAQAALAAADPTTGVDWTADVSDPAIAAIKPALLAGLAVFVLFVAISGGRKLWSKVTKTG